MDRLRRGTSTRQSPPNDEILPSAPAVYPPGLMSATSGIPVIQTPRLFLPTPPQEIQTQTSQTHPIRPARGPPQAPRLHPIQPVAIQAPHLHPLHPAGTQPPLLHPIHTVGSQAPHLHPINPAGTQTSWSLDELERRSLESSRQIQALWREWDQIQTEEAERQRNAAILSEPPPPSYQASTSTSSQLMMNERISLAEHFRTHGYNNSGNFSQDQSTVDGRMLTHLVHRIEELHSKINRIGKEVQDIGKKLNDIRKIVGDRRTE